MTMKTPKASVVSPVDDADPSPPRGFSKAEKSEFRRVCVLRRNAGNPVRAIEADALADYVMSRARLAVWQKKLTWGLAVPPDSHNPNMFLSQQIAVAATVDRAAAACRRLARDLGLGRA
ncbi:hypothetical protein LJR090_001792 [Bosea sp. LjRoot90]|uniref:hypothetical protein n=1 Tax=Bosea sp. LjRoot90 TaxID=3342342 RepID=UPI003ECC4D73